MADQILTLAELARKAETEQEKARAVCMAHDLNGRRDQPHCIRQEEQANRNGWLVASYHGFCDRILSPVSLEP